MYLSRKESSKCCHVKIQTRFVFVGNRFLLYALTIFFQILWKVLQVPHRNSVHNLVISGEASKKKVSVQQHFGCLVYYSVFSGNILSPKIEYKNANGFV